MTQAGTAVTAPTPDPTPTPVRPRFAAVLFDMDGTLVNSDGAVERVWREWAREHGLDEAEVLATVPGRQAEDSIRLLRPELDEAGVAADAASQLDRECAAVDDVVANPGARALLDALDAAGVPWAVVTNANAPLAHARLGAAGIVPPVLVDRDAVTLAKPDPEPYRLGAARLGVDPAACLVVEDTATGAEAGRAAGAEVAGLKGIDAHHPLRTLTDLLEVIR